MKELQQIERFEIRLSGTGGQGLITLGRVLGHSLALGHGYNVTQTQSYGPEARGGSSRADVVVSSSAISFPKTENLDLLVALSQPACNAYYRSLKRGGVLLVDSELVQHAPTNQFVGLPFTKLAKEKIGNELTLNTIVLGAVTHLLAFAEPRIVRKSLEETLPPKIQALNIKAFNLGLREAKRHLGEAPEIWQSAAENGAEEELNGFED